MTRRKRAHTYGEEREWTCVECDSPVPFTFYRGHKAQTYGPPENCEPEEPDTVDAPEECPKCGTKIDEDALIESVGMDDFDDPRGGDGDDD